VCFILLSFKKDLALLRLGHQAAPHDSIVFIVCFFRILYILKDDFFWGDYLYPEKSLSLYIWINRSPLCHLRRGYRAKE